MGYIYLVTNKINGKKYIGQTINSIETRWAQHKSEAKRLIPNVYFVRALNKYGIDNFVIEELEKCDNSILDAREQFYIKLYDTNNKEKGYNSTIGGNSNNRKFERQKVLSLWNSGLTVGEISNQLDCCNQTVTTILQDNGIDEHDRRSRSMKLSSELKKKPVLQYSLQGKLINKFSCVEEAALKTGYHENSIRGVCNHRLSQVGNYIWCHEDESKQIEQLIAEIPLAKTKRPISQYTLQGEFIQNYMSIVDAANALGVHRASIESALSNENYHCANYLWKYQDEDSDIMDKVERYKHRKDYHKRAINQYDLQGNFLQTFDSAASAAIAIGKPGNGSSITKACNGKLKSAYKYKWAYA